MKRIAMIWTTVFWLVGGLSLEGEFGPVQTVHPWIQAPVGRRPGVTLSAVARDWHFPDHATFRRVRWTPDGEMRVTLSSGDVLTFEQVDSTTVETWNRSRDKERYFSRQILGGCPFRAPAKGGDPRSGGGSWLP